MEKNTHLLPQKQGWSGENMHDLLQFIVGYEMCRKWRNVIYSDWSLLFISKHS